MHCGARMQRAVTTLRSLTVADLPAIHDICRGVYDGVDYLPGRMQAWLDDESVHTIGLEQGGMLVSTGKRERRDARRLGDPSGYTGCHTAFPRNCVASRQYTSTSHYES